MGNGAYGASVPSPGFGTDKGAGSEGSVARGVVWALPVVASSAVNSSAAKADPIVFLCIAVAAFVMALASAFDSQPRLYHCCLASVPGQPLRIQGAHQPTTVSPSRSANGISQLPQR